MTPDDAKLRALAEFAAGAGHEINNPVATIAGHAQRLLRDEADPDRRHALLTIGAQAYRIRDMHEVLPTMTERDAPVAVALAKAVETVLGRQPAFVVSPGTYDQKHIDRIGRLRNCVAYGPGILDLAHQPDEYVGVDDMTDAATVMALALADLLGAGN